MKDIVWKVELKEINTNNIITSFHKNVLNISKCYNINPYIIRNMISGVRKNKCISYNNLLYDIVISQELIKNINDVNLI